MRLAICCLILLPLAAAAPIRAPSENILSFLNDALGAATEKNEPASTTAQKDLAHKPVREQDSEDVSDDKSREMVLNNGLKEPEVSNTNNGGASRDLNSDEIPIPQAPEKDKMTSKTKTGADRDTVAQVDWHYGSREHPDLNSEEGLMSAGTQGRRSGGDLLTNGGRRGVGAAGVLAPQGRSRELVDPDSLENNNGRPAAVGDRLDVDYDETREFISAETRPLAPAPAKTRTFGRPRDSVPAIC